MAEENALGQEKSEAPTSRRRQKSRQKGSVARSKEINSAVLLFFGLCIFALYGPFLMSQIIGLIRYSFINFPTIEVTYSSFQTFAVQRVWFVLKLLIPVFFVFIVVGIVVNVAQFGWLFTKETIFQGFKNFSINPAKFIKKIFSTSTVVTLAINIAKLTILITLAYITIKKEMPIFPTLVRMPVSESLHYIASMIFMLGVKICILLLILATLDFIWQKFKHEKSLKMTKQEVKDEHKQMEGDPKIRAQIRSAQRKMMIATMVRNVPEADVVITNPFHIAIAIKYDPGVMAAPRVLAKGARLIAERIKAAARIASVPIVENKPLAQTIYKTVDVGDEIPPKLYQAVAEILAYVYQLNKSRARQYATVS